MKRRLPRDEAKRLADEARLAKIWRKWHAEQLAEAVAGAHGAIVAELMGVLDRLELDSAATLLNFMQRADWSSVSYGVRLEALHQVNQSITRLRERNGLSPFDDGVPGERDNVFRRIKDLMFAAPPGAHPGSNQMKRGNDEQVKYG